MLSELGHGYDTDWRAASGTGHHEKAGSQEGERQLEKVGHASRVVQTLRAHEDTAGRPGPVDTFFDVLCATHSGAARTAVTGRHTSERIVTGLAGHNSPSVLVACALRFAAGIRSCN